MTVADGAGISAFLAAHGWDAAERVPLAGDASARRYWRVRRTADGACAILAHSPDPVTDVVAFARIAEFLCRLGLSAPAVLAADPARGLLLVEDFGDARLGTCVAAGVPAEPVYGLAVDVLVHLHRHCPPAQAAALGLPHHDAATLVEQVMLFVDAYVPAATGRPVSEAARAAWRAAWTAVVPAACAGPWSLLLRDYHLDNLMHLPERPGVRAAGLLDFQNAGPGPIAYDLVSLLEDARRDLAPNLAARMIARYRAAFPQLDGEAFELSYTVLGALRHARILGVFARLALRDGRRHYLVHVPRVWRQLEAKLAEPALAEVAAWFERHPMARHPLPIPEEPLS